MGIVQGLTEFLPVSSQAHIILLAELARLREETVLQGQTLEVAAHAGSLLAIVLYFHKQTLMMLKGLTHTATGNDSSERALLWKVVVASLPIIAVGLTIKLQGAENELRSPTVIAASTVIFALILLMADRRPAGKNIEQLSLGEAFFIGLFQCFALIPGASRSGVAMTMGRFLALSPKEAAGFSLLLSMPAIAGAVTLNVIAAPSILLSAEAAMIAFFSFVSSLAAVALMLKWLERAGFGVFVAYRLVLGAVLFAAFA